MLPCPICDLYAVYGILGSIVLTKPPRQARLNYGGVDDSMSKLLEYVSYSTSIGDFVLDIFEMSSLKKQQKKGLYLTIGTHLALSALAVGVSAYQTNSIKKEIRRSNRH